MPETGSYAIASPAKSPELLEHLLHHSPNCVLQYAPLREDGHVVDFSIVMANEQAVKIMGKTRSDILSASFCSLCPEVHANGVFALFQEVLKTGEPLTREVFLEHFGGWSRLSLSRIGEENLVGIFLNINDLKESFLEQRHLAEWHSYIMNHSYDGILTLKALRNEDGMVSDFSLESANRAAHRFFPPNALGRPVTHIFPNYKNDGVFDRFTKVVQSGEPLQHEYRYEAEGQAIWFNVSIARHFDGLVISYTDITATKEKHELLKRIIDALDSMIALYEPVFDAVGTLIDFRYKLVNKARQKQDGVPLLGRLVSEVFPPFLENGTFEQYRQAYYSGSQQSFDLHYSLPGGDVYGKVLLTRLDQDLMVTYTDHSELRRLQATHEETIADLKYSKRNLEDFAYTASHDLKEPVRKIHFFGDLLKDRLVNRLNEEEIGLFNRISHASKRMGALIDDLLMYSHTSHLPPEMETVDLQEAVTKVLDDLELDIAQKQAHISMDRLPVVQGYPSQLQQLFKNLVGNALKYSRPGIAPRIGITATIIGSKELDPRFPGAATKEYHFIEVKDNGIGFEQEHAERIFQMFQRLHGNAEYSGTGVGLAIARKVVDNHQGKILAESMPGEGACFKIYLPLQAERTS